jgi:3-oxoacyl-(acyl-carrier-protein) synthase
VSAGCGAAAVSERVGPQAAAEPGGRQPASAEPATAEPAGGERVGRAASLAQRATAAGLAVHATASWPESAMDGVPPAVAGFIVSSFSPLVAEVAERCLRRRFGAPPTAPAGEARIALVLVSDSGDVTTAVEVARAVDAGRRVGPLLFFQAVPNAVAGYVAARWALTGPVVCLSSTGDGLDIAALLIDDGDADEVLVVLADQATADDEGDSAAAVLVGPHPEPSGSATDQAEGASR